MVIFLISYIFYMILHISGLMAFFLKM